MAEDTLLICESCGQSRRESFAACLASRWPKCCGYAMAFESTSADVPRLTREAIEAAVEDALAAQTTAHTG